jgi:hypothetical protein
VIFRQNSLAFRTFRSFREFRGPNYFA